jgi:hypothetical protein
MVGSVFDHLDAVTSFRARGVCRAWCAHAAAGCAFLRFDHFDSDHLGEGEAKHLKLLGRRARLTRAPTGGCAGAAAANDATAAATAGFSRARWLNRTSGRLPAPEVMEGAGGAEAELTAEEPLDARVARKGGAYAKCVGVRIEAGGMAAGARRVLRALQLGASTVQSSVKAHAGQKWGADGVAVPGPLFDMLVGKKPRPMRRVLRVADLSALRWLRSLSVKGCTHLDTLLLPPSLTALDASTSSLKAAAFVAGGARALGGLEVLNLGNCREITARATTWTPTLGFEWGRHPLLSALSACREIDLSWCHSLPTAAVSEGLAAAACLVSASLRSVASDEVLIALGASGAARSGRLSLVDCAFSKQLSDAGVAALTRQARGLVRLNLRGCSKVSTECYNQTPIVLLARASEQAGAGAGAGAGDPREDDSSSGALDVGGAARSGNGAGASCPPPPQKLRKGGAKGDNVFFLVAGR